MGRETSDAGVEVLMLSDTRTESSETNMMPNSVCVTQT